MDASLARRKYRRVSETREATAFGMSAVGFGAVSLMGLALLVKYVKRRKGDGRDVQPAVGAAAPGTLQARPLDSLPTPWDIHSQSKPPTPLS